MLAHYDAPFPSFVAAFEPARALACLADVAQLEWLRVQAYHAADAQPLAPERIARALAEPACLPAARMTLHPSAATLASRYAIVSLSAAHQGIGELGDVDPHCAERALVLRSALEVDVLRLDPGAASFVASLARGSAFGEAAAEACAAHATFDFAATLAILIRAGAIIDLHLPGSPPS